MNIKTLLQSLGICLSLIFITSCDQKNERENSHQYICPMHTKIVEEEAGNCPICKMSLIKKKESDSSYNK